MDAQQQAVMWTLFAALALMLALWLWTNRRDSAKVVGMTTTSLTPAEQDRVRYWLREKATSGKMIEADFATKVLCWLVDLETARSASAKGPMLVIHAEGPITITGVPDNDT
jgi:hypothetical protein